MAEETEAPPATPPPKDQLRLRTRREPFEYGLLPIPKLIFSDCSATLGTLKEKLLQRASSFRVDSSAIADSLQISPEHSRLVLDTLASILPSDSDPLVCAKPDEVESVGVNVFDLILFLYIQTYKKLLPRTHKDSAAVADVWPSTSAFDGYLSALSPLQLVRSNSRKFPSQSDEEAHQLSYLQKHFANIVSLLAEPVEGEGDESLVLSMERFEHLGFLIQFDEKGSETVPLSQVAPFFANSDPDMPAAAVSAAQLHDWLLEKVADALEQIAERATAKENGPSSGSDQDVAMADATTNPSRALTSSRGLFLVEGISKSSYVKQAAEVKNSSLKVGMLHHEEVVLLLGLGIIDLLLMEKVINCHDSVIYVLAPLRYATIYGCSDATIVLGAVGKALRVEHCERVHVISAAKRVCIASCRECVFFLGVNQRPLMVGDNHKLQVGPYNTHYAQLEEQLKQVGIEPTINKWNEPLALGVVDPHDSLSHPAGVSDVQAETASLLDPDQFTNFLIPNWFASEAPGETKDNPFSLPEPYLTSQQKKHTHLGEAKQILKETLLNEGKKKELSCALHVLFKDWLYGKNWYPIL
ncbi:hypothetical protein Cgig2_012156 [Carnegiea gigantea]|uniref:TBCC domain-containing protein 1 n=1 Tax=Carnegiea gigantea TaxID=171969 RepID=A0A9Q1QN93_9CARY|nr:hypothetical protein Cgig2_012156 [Carnegiea gigantea]